MIAPYIETEALDPVRMKGKAQAVVTHRVIPASEIRSRFEAAKRRGLTTYTGRDHELGTVHACLKRCMCGEGQLITVEGEAGVGKSRLL